MVWESEERESEAPNCEIAEKYLKGKSAPLVRKYKKKER